MALPLGDLARVRSAMTERELVTAVRRGDDAAFEQLFERYRRRIGAYVYGLVGDHGRTEDITQEVFLSALRRLRQTDGPLAFRPWIYEIARNACIDEYRRSSRVSLVPLETSEPVAGPPVPRPPDHGSPEGHWERKQQLGHLTGAFSGLSEIHHRILVMRELEGLSYAEIADRLGMTRAMVESTLFRARRRLAHEYEELASGRRCAAVRAAIDAHPQRAVSSLGIRERRRIGRHLGLCRGCLAHARAAGIKDATLRRPSLGERVGALAPVGWLLVLWRRGAGPSPGGLAVRRLSVLGHNVGPSVSAGPAAAAAAAVLVAGGVPLVSAIERPAGANERHVTVAAPAGVPSFVSRPRQRGDTAGAVPAMESAVGRSASPAGRGAGGDAASVTRSGGLAHGRPDGPARAGSIGSAPGTLTATGHAGGLLTGARGRMGAGTVGRAASGAVGTVSSRVHQVGATVGTATSSARHTTTQAGGHVRRTPGSSGPLGSPGRASAPRR